MRTLERCLMPDPWCLSKKTVTNNRNIKRKKYLYTSEVILMSECTHNCSTCGQDCASRTEKSLLAQLNPQYKVRKV